MIYKIVSKIFVLLKYLVNKWYYTCRSKYDDNNVTINNHPLFDSYIINNRLFLPLYKERNEERIEE